MGGPSIRKTEGVGEGVKISSLWTDSNCSVLLRLENLNLPLIRFRIRLFEIWQYKPSFSVPVRWVPVKPVNCHAIKQAQLFSTSGFPANMPSAGIDLAAFN